MTAFAPPQGERPTLEWIEPARLQIDPSYQRSIDTVVSKRLIRRIAEGWRWDLCLPLLTSKRPDGSLFVVDGQHRAEAARLRGDILILPCYVRQLAGAPAEAALFVSANRHRKPMSAIDDFHAAVAAGDETATMVAELLEQADLRMARASVPTLPIGEVNNAAGILSAYRKHGAGIVGDALLTIGEAFPDDHLVNIGQLFDGIVALLTRKPPIARDAIFNALLADTTRGWSIAAAGEQARLKSSRTTAMATVIAAKVPA